MQKKILLAAITATSLLTVAPTVHAADLPQRPVPARVESMLSPVSVYNWTGIYVGVNGGYGWGKQDPLNIITNRFDDKSISMSGGFVGGTAGGQVQAGRVVIGLEADLDWASIKGSAVFNPSVAGVPLGPVNASTDISWVSTVRTRLGYANDNVLWYVTGGLALLGAKTDLTTVGGAVCSTILNNCSGHTSQVGLAVGGGVEYGFSPNWSTKLEYLYITAASLDISSHSEVRMGLNYRFGGN